MRDLIKEFGNVRVVRVVDNDDSGRPAERFIVTLRDETWREFRSRERAIDRALDLSQRQGRTLVRPARR